VNATRSVLFEPVARGLFFVLHVFAVYLLLRGHDLPGGGFIGGLVSAIAWVMLGLALGWSEVGRVLRVDPARLAAMGLLVAGVTGAAPMLWGRAFFEQFFWHGSVPFLGELHVGTPLAFDAGVFLVVVGITVKMIVVLGRSTSGMRAFPRVEEDRYFSVVEEPIEGQAAAPKVKGGTDAG
jgi:multicomponent Na+:H+ antiporter subunit B